MKVVGITGGIGSGKTTVCKIFELLGVPVFYADDEAKNLYSLPKIKSKVVKLFGQKVLDKNKQIDKKIVAEIVFSDKYSLSKLNSIIHPEVSKQFNAWKKKHKGSKIVMKEAAIMIESKSYLNLDYLISVNSTKELRIKRVLSKGSLNVEDIEHRMSEQLSDEEREKYSDAVIVNDESHSLIEQVFKLHKKLTGK